jgi:glutamate dehydrogenase/leucine dehydrogenase
MKQEYRSKDIKPGSPMRVGLLGFGGLGQAAARILAAKREMIWVAAADKKGYAYNPEGLDPDQCIAAYHQKGSVGYLDPVGILSGDSIGESIANAQVMVISWHCPICRIPLWRRWHGNLSHQVGVASWWMPSSLPVR